MNMIRTNICIGKYSTILENPNICHTLFGNLRFKVMFMKLLRRNQKKTPCMFVFIENTNKLHFEG